MIYLLAFLTYLTLDLVWGFYIIAAARRKHWQAAGFAAGIAAFNGATVLFVVENPLTIFALIAGAFVGTLIAVKYHPEAHYDP
jgi:hypothetical protein